MKFSELPVGRRFEYEGERYLKSGPLVATHETSGQRRFIPQYGAVMSLTAAPEAPATHSPQGTVDLKDALAELDVFYARCLELLAALDADTGQTSLDEARNELRLARDRLIAALAARGTP